MVIIETPIFTKKIKLLIDDDSYQQFQIELISHPDKGNIVQGSGGIRKIRLGLTGRGKRGGARILYYWAKNKDQIYMLFAYEKNEMTDLSKNQLSILKKMVEVEFKNGQ
jgi:hypothetical protein